MCHFENWGCEMVRSVPEELGNWQCRIQACECSGLRLLPKECYELGLLLEVAYDKILELQSECDILGAHVNAMDTTGSRRRLGMQREDSATPCEARTRSAAGWRAETEDQTGKSQFRNL